MIALGVIAAVRLASKRLEARGVGSTDDMSSIAMWAVPAGVVGSRLYHVITDWSRFDGDVVEMAKIWKGGLGIWGGIALGVPVGLYVAHRRGLSIGPALTCIVPALPLAQAIGRWGNWWNQELFGRATTLPWGLEISPDKTMAAGFPVGTVFHPTFLYESIACVLICLGLLALDRRMPMRPGRLFFVYTASYTAFRFFIEGIRIDPTHHVGGLRINQWVSLVIFSLSILVLATDRWRGGTVQLEQPDDAGSTVDTYE